MDTERTNSQITSVWGATKALARLACRKAPVSSLPDARSQQPASKTCGGFCCSWRGHRMDGWSESGPGSDGTDRPLSERRKPDKNVGRAGSSPAPRPMRQAGKPRGNRVRNLPAPGEYRGWRINPQPARWRNGKSATAWRDRHLDTIKKPMLFYPCWETMRQTSDDKRVAEGSKRDKTMIDPPAGSIARQIMCDRIAP